jgi:nicotinamide riboside transporter PnuC
VSGGVHTTPSMKGIVRQAGWKFYHDYSTQMHVLRLSIAIALLQEWKWRESRKAQRIMALRPSISILWTLTCSMSVVGVLSKSIAFLFLRIGIEFGLEP